MPGSFGYALHYLIEHELDLSYFDEYYCNDSTGAPAFDPRVMLKIILYAYAHGMISSRDISWCCDHNILFMALSADSHPHFTTIASFVRRHESAILRLFRDIVVICDGYGLIGQEMFALDGCKLASNASKEWSGTMNDFERKLQKVENALHNLLQKHQEQDQKESDQDPEVRAYEEQYVASLQAQTKKLKEWIAAHDDRRSRAGNVVKSNLTDNESAKMTTSHGVIQGYVGAAVVDEKNQVVVNAEAFGEAQENHLLQPMIEGVYSLFSGSSDDVFANTQFSADSGFHTEQNMRYLAEKGIDAYVADNKFRTRDERFDSAVRHKPKEKRPVGRFTPADFILDQTNLTCICPAGHRLYLKNRRVKLDHYFTLRFQAPKTDCISCSLRSKCLRSVDQKTSRQVNFIYGDALGEPETYTQKMKRKIDTDYGRAMYARRLSTVEPVFTNIRWNKGLSHFTLRGTKKVTTQWRLFCMVHNIEKINRY
ncbi:transposase [candidate division CSSED10-310 bacterium]|uniref:Transposase n=1 Tax=candidate division CSSED10-310 bacterium TaxID=2855610 RepID=A0ABV6YVY4_UNCC1